MDDNNAKPLLDRSPDSERQVLVEFLDMQRYEFGARCAGLTREQLAITTAASDLTLGGLLKHMALVEEIWFDHRLAGNDEREPWASVDWDNDPDWEMRTARDDSPEALFARWKEACELSRTHVSASDSLSRVTEKGHPKTGEKYNLRWIIVHLIEEYARHLGHADFIRESIDGVRGQP